MRISITAQIFNIAPRFALNEDRLKTHSDEAIEFVLGIAVRPRNFTAAGNVVKKSLDAIKL